MDFKKLAEPFPPDLVEWRLQSTWTNDRGIGGRALAYLTNRAIMDRLDAVCGQDKWKNSFSVAPGGGVLCGIAIKCGDEWVAKYDGAENTDIEKVKGGLSGSMKRAAVQWGIGRYLYGLDADYIRVVQDKNAPGAKYGKTKEGKEFGWYPKDLPAWALPGNAPPAAPAAPAAPQQTQGTPVKDATPKITDGQRKKLHVAFRALGHDDDKRHAYLAENYGGRSSLNDLSKEEASALLDLMAGATA